MRHTAAFSASRPFSTPESDMLIDLQRRRSRAACAFGDVAGTRGEHCTQRFARTNVEFQVKSGLWLVQLGKPGLWWWFISRMPISITDLGRIPGGLLLSMTNHKENQGGTGSRILLFSRSHLIRAAPGTVRARQRRTLFKIQRKRDVPAPRR
jgi:hypothetical protein